MFTLKLKQVFIFIILILPGICIAQTKGCIDSGNFNRYYPSFLNIENFSDEYYYTLRDNADNIYMGGETNFSAIDIYSSILKFNSKNQMVFYKNYKKDIFSNSIFFRNLVSIDEKANLLFTGIAGRQGDTVYKTIFKLDSAGNYLWGKKIRNTDGGPSNQIRLTTVYTNNSNEVFGTVIYNNTSIVGLIAFNGMGNIKWAKNYSHLTMPKFNTYNSFRIVSQNNNTLVLCYPFYYNADTATNPNAINGVQFVKINKADGSILQHNAFGLFMDKNFTVPYSGFLNQINYNPASGLFLIDFSRDLFIPNPYLNHVYCTVDANLNPVKSAVFRSLNNPIGGTILNKERTNIDGQNNITLGYPFTELFFGGPETFSYTAINENLDIVTQKKLNLTNLGFPNTGFFGNIAYKKNGIISFQLLTNSNSINKEIYLYDNSPYYNGNTICSGIDTPIYVKSPMYIKPLSNVVIEEAGALPVAAVSVFPDAVINFQLPKQQICTETSICDTIKLIGTGKYHCLTNPVDSFKILRNPLCKRNTNWQLDSNYIKTIASTDTSLVVQYLKPYRGYVKVSFGGCYLTDSLAIEVNEAKKSVNIGNDTMLCPGKSITLKTGYKFKSYQWQDGSNLDSLVVTQPGKYWVMVSDSCNNIFSDTIEIKPFDSYLQLNYPQAICQNDTAIISLPSTLYNYSWQPAASAQLQNLQWRLYPTGTTIYNITGERMPGCTISDTVLVMVKECPEYMFFPNAFTPNDDGINDIYKPGYSGRLLIFELTIFNRYGQPVFKTKDAATGWNGRFKNSKPLPGSYVWICRYQFSNKPVKEEKGMLTLIR